MVLVFQCRSQSFKLHSSTYFNIKDNVFLRKKINKFLCKYNTGFQCQIFQILISHQSIHLQTYSALVFLQATRNIASTYGQCSINEWRIPSFTRQRKPMRFFPCHCLDARGHSTLSVTRSPHGQPKPPLGHRPLLKQSDSGYLDCF